MRVVRIPCKGSRVVYQLRDDDDNMFANFETLAAAASVMRYVSGGDMDSDERQRAYLAMSLVDSKQTAKDARRTNKGF